MKHAWASAERERELRGVEKLPDSGGNEHQTVEGSVPMTTTSTGDWKLLLVPEGVKLWLSAAEEGGERGRAGYKLGGYLFGH